jgi:hypothetical protein
MTNALIHSSPQRSLNDEMLALFINPINSLFKNISCSNGLWVHLGDILQADP